MKNRKPQAPENDVAPSEETTCVDTWPWPLNYQFKTTKGNMRITQLVSTNWQPAATVALVSVVLSIALGLASGASAQTGLATAIWGGLTFGVFASSPYNIIGPAGALSGMLNSYSVLWGPDILPWISLFSAAFVLLFYLLRLYSFMMYMPTSVFEGFTVAVAFIIGFGQMNFAFGLEPEEKHPEFIANFFTSISILDEATWESTLLFFLLAWPLWYFQRHVPKIPWVVVISFATLLLGWLSEEGHLHHWNIPTLRSKYDDLDGQVIVLPNVTALSDAADDLGGVLVAAASVAVVAVLETLISAKIAGTRANDDFDHHTEVRALTGAHVLCGLFGALPCTGVFVRTSLNQSLGSNHIGSQFMNAVIVLLIVVLLMPVFSYLPLPTVAAVLVVASLRMLPMTVMKRLYNEDRVHFGLLAITALISIVLDPVMGLLAGTLFALLLQAKRSGTSEAQVTFEPCAQAQMGKLTFTGDMTYLNGEALFIRARELLAEAKPEDLVNGLLLDLRHVPMVDMDAADQFALFYMSYRVKLTAPGAKIRVGGCNKSVTQQFKCNAKLNGLVEGSDGKLVFIRSPDELTDVNVTPAAEVKDSEAKGSEANTSEQTGTAEPKEPTGDLATHPALADVFAAPTNPIGN